MSQAPKKILWLSWKDLAHPLSGGAEVVQSQLAQRLVADGHELLLVTGGFKGGAAEVQHPDGYRIVRVGNRVSVYWRAYRYYKQHLGGWADLVIDEINTVPFFAKFYVREPNVVLVHQLCRQIWFYELPPPFSLIGYLAEPLYLRLLKGRTAITVSDSTKRDLMRCGFKSDDIHIISEGLDPPAPSRLELRAPNSEPVLLSLGSIRPMKRTMHQLQAFELAKAEIPELKLIIAGDDSGKYGQKVRRAATASPYATDIEFIGRVSGKTKQDLMKTSDVILVTSVKEGWGLIVSEAAGQGTPAAVYNVDGLRDSVQQGKSGVITEQNNPQSLAAEIVRLLGDRGRYEKLRREGHAFARTLTFNKSYKEFKEALDL